MLLEVKGLVKRFGGLRAVDHVSFSLSEGELVGLIGPNGSGKTTLLNLIRGALRPDGGEIWFQNQRIDGLPPHEVFRRGIVSSFQVPRTFQRVTVAENLMLPPHPQRGELPWAAPFKGLWLGQETRLSEEVAETLKLLKIMDVHRSWGSEISGGQMKLTEIGRAIQGRGRLVLMDEPAAGVALPLAHEIFSRIRQLNKERGVTFLIVEHRLDVLFKYVERLLVMHEGRMIYDGSVEKALEDERVINAYLGGEWRRAS